MQFQLQAQRSLVTRVRALSRPLHRRQRVVGWAEVLEYVQRFQNGLAFWLADAALFKGWVEPDYAEFLAQNGDAGWQNFDDLLGLGEPLELFAHTRLAQINQHPRKVVLL